MPIDWFTVGAQILNFLVLVWILKRFLYRPVLKVMDERQRRVEESMLAASVEKRESEKVRAAFEKKSEDLESGRQATLAAAARDAEAERTRMVAEAREEFQGLRHRWRETLRNDQDNLQKEIATRVQRETLAIAGQLVRELADENLQEALARKFVRKLEEMVPEERARLAPSHDEQAGGEAVIRSAFELGDVSREEIERAARGVVGEETPFRFETKSSLGAGIELAVNGRKASWTIENYLGSLDAGVRELIEKETGRDEFKKA